MASHRVAGRKLSRYKDQRVALLRGLVAELMTHERITTTLAKAKETRVIAEKLITHGKKGIYTTGVWLWPKCRTPEWLRKCSTTLLLGTLTEKAVTREY